MDFPGISPQKGKLCDEIHALTAHYPLLKITGVRFVKKNVFPFNNALGATTVHNLYTDAMHHGLLKSDSV